MELGDPRAAAGTRMAFAVSVTHFLSADKEKRLCEYLIYLLRSKEGNVNVNAIYRNLLNDREFALRMTEMPFSFLEECENTNFPTLPPATEEEVWAMVSKFCSVLTKKRLELGKNKYSFYLYNYSGYGLNAPQLEGKDSEEKKKIRLAGMHRTFKAMPIESFRELEEILNKGTLPEDLESF